MIVVKGESHKVLCCVQEVVMIVDSPVERGDREHESQGLVLCPRGHGDSRQGRVTKYHVAFRKAW